jgi:hypothetical protein
MRKISNKKLSLFISSVYVVLGTTYGVIYWTPANIFGKLLFYPFMPVCFAPIGLMFTERNPFFLILITQTITFFLIWGLVYFGLHLFRKSASDNSQQL